MLNFERVVNEGQNTLDRSELNVLLIEAHLGHGSAMRRLLTNMGVDSVHMVSKGQEALDVLGRGGFDLVFCDIEVPGVDGVEFLQDLAELPEPPAVCLLAEDDLRIIKAAEAMARMRGLNLLGSLAQPVQANRVDAMLTKLAGPQTGNFKTAGGDLLKATDLSLGLQKGAVELLFQPVVNVEGGSLQAVEAFLRWNDEKHGLLGPSYVVPAAERHGFIDELAREVVVQAVDQAAKWKEDGLLVRVAINISDMNLEVQDFPEFVAATIDRSGLETSQFSLEVAESAINHSQQRQIRMMERLRRHGLRLTLDDYGGGIEAQDLREMPFTDIKVDRAYVAGANRNPERRAAFRQCIHLARMLRIPAIAKGIETQEDWMFVIDSGGTAAQGFHIAKPMASAPLRAWAARPNHAPGRSGINLIA